MNYKQAKILPISNIMGNLCSDSKEYQEQKVNNIIPEYRMPLWGCIRRMLYGILANTKIRNLINRNYRFTVFSFLFPIFYFYPCSTNLTLSNTAELNTLAAGNNIKSMVAQRTPKKSHLHAPSTSNTSLPTKTAPIFPEESAGNNKTVAGLIEQAHKYDAAYTLGDTVNREKGLSLYQSALAAKPDEKQRLHILYRMAQLNGSTYRKDKGEKPDYTKAISLYKEIIESYPAEEPLVFKAMSSLCDCYTSLRQFEQAVKWAKKTLEYDTHQITEHIESIEQRIQDIEDAGKSVTAEEELEIRQLIKQIDSLQKKLAQIKRYQEIAVDQVAYSADLISPLHADSELKSIIDKYYGTFIADRAYRHFVENMNKMAQLWAPQEKEPSLPSGSSIQASGQMTVTNSGSQKDILAQSNTHTEITEKCYPVEINTTEILQKDKHVVREPRAPPLMHFSTIILITGLIITALVIVILRKN